MDEIYEALKILGLSGKASLNQIKNAYHKLIHQWHPDKCMADPELCKTKTAELINAFRKVKNFCYNFSVDFTFRENESENPEDQWNRQWGPNDPIFGKGK